MKTKYNIIIFVIIVLVGAFFMLTDERSAISTVAEPTTRVYSNSEIGLEFDYKVGPDGYSHVEIDAEEGEKEFLKSIILMHEDDLANVENIPEGGEGPPVIAILVFKNLKKQSSRIWAEAHPKFTNINLKQGEVTESVVGGANAIRYMADGLYASEIVVVAHGDNVYVLNGMFIDAESSLRKDFMPLVESVRFIPQEGQEKQ
jgi:hypothetical protein